MPVAPTDDAVITFLRTWLLAQPPGERSSRGQWLVSHLWAIHRELSGPADPNLSRKRAQRLKEMNLCITVPRGNGAEAMAREQEAYREKCRQETTRLSGMLHAGAYGLYMPEVHRRIMSPRMAVWQLADGSWLTPRPDKPLYGYSDLYASLSLPRVPVPFTFDEACFIADF